MDSVSAALVMIALGACMASADSVTLQQGAAGYAGCSARVVGPGGEESPKAVLPLRGSKSQFHIRFELPADLAGKKLARARMGLFLPEARKPNVFTEILCGEVIGGTQAPVGDDKTDYDNGRPAGAVDSVELFAPKGPGWGDYPWLKQGIPAGGEWIEFNVTALAEKWLKDPSANHGVLIVPTDCPDKRFPSTWEIDIPGPDAPTLDQRPRLTLEFAPLEEDYLVGMTHGLQQILDRSTRYAYRGGYGSQYKMSMAANEFEGFQVVLYPLLEDLRNVRFTWGDLADAAGKKIPAADIECFVVDWYTLRANWQTRDLFYRGKLYDVPDPLVPARPAVARRHLHTPFYFRVRTRPDTAPGLYRGTLTVQADNAKPTELSLEVKVWPYAIPQRWNFHTMGQLVWENLTRFHGKELDAQLIRKYYDFLLDHRFSPTEQYNRILSPRTDLGHCLQRGMNTVYLSGNFTGSDAEMQRLKGDYESVKKLGALDHALVYVGDETNKWDEMHRRANLVHANLPGVQVMVGGSFPRPELMGYIDIHDPQIGGGNKVYSLEQDSVRLIGESQKRGEEFYWYVAAGPSYPYPNVQMEYPLAIGRALFWMTWKYGVTGFEYYCYNIWERNYPRDPAQRYPNSRWLADGWSRGWPSNADGMLFYPGPISSLRFEAIRDGIEDWESLQTLADCVAAVKDRKHPEKHKNLIAQAEPLLAVREEIVAGFNRHTREADRLLAERETLGELLAKFVPRVDEAEKWDAGQMTLAKAAEVRLAAQTALRRKTLRERHAKACQALNVPPLPQEQWDALWPKRVLFQQSFEEGGDKRFDWDGQAVTDNVPPGARRAILGDTQDKHFARRVRVGIYWDNARAATTTWVRFKYFVNKPEPITVFVFDMTQSDNWECVIQSPAVGRWAGVTLNVTADFRKKGGGDARVRAGDGLDDVFVFAGKPGDADLRLWVADVSLIGLD